MRSLLVIFICSVTVLSGRSQDVNEVIHLTMKNIEKNKTISHYSKRVSGNGTDLNNVDFNEPTKGTCTFKIVNSDTVIGAHYSIKYEIGITASYNSSTLSRINFNDSTVTITDLEAHPFEKTSIVTTLLYRYSVLGIYNMLKESDKYNKGLKKLLPDTTIAGEKCFKIILSERNPEKDEEYMTYDISISRKTYLPMHCMSVYFSPLFGCQIIHHTLSDYKLNDKNIKDDLFTGNDAPKHFKRVSYTPEKYVAREAVVKVGMQAPDWELPTVDNKTISSSSLKGKTNLLVFSGVHCGYCVFSLPKLNNIQEKFSDKNFSMYSIYSDADQEKLKKYIDRHKIKYTLLYNGPEQEKEQKVKENYGINGIPHFVLLNEKGEVTNIWSGYSTDIEESITKAIEKLL